MFQADTVVTKGAFTVIALSSNRLSQNTFSPHSHPLPQHTGETAHRLLVLVFVALLGLPRGALPPAVAAHAGRFVSLGVRACLEHVPHTCVCVCHVEL